jgi:hypothetical protein
VTIAVLFWVLYIVSLLFGIWANYTPNEPFAISRWGGGFLMFILIGLLGWAQFGGPVR